MGTQQVLIGNPLLMRQTNARTLLGLVKKLGACSRTELRLQTGMSMTTIVNVVDDLIRLDLLESIGAGASSGGRRPDMLQFKAGHAWITGFDVGHDSLRAVLTDLNGTTLAEECRALTPEHRTPEAVVKQIAVLLRALEQRSGQKREKLLALTVGVQGITDPAEGMVVNVSSLKNWRDIPLRKMLAEYVSAEIFIENDSNLAAIGEHFEGAAKDNDNFIFIIIGSGLGAGIFLNGQVYRGADGTAGEIGYLHIPHIPSIRPSLYDFGRLEKVLAGPGILKSWNTAVQKDSGKPRLRHPGDVLDLALEGNSLAKKIVQQRAILLKDVILNISLILNPSLFVLGGEVGAHPALLEPTASLLVESEFAIARLTPSKLGGSAVVTGAIAVGLKYANDILPRF